MKLLKDEIEYVAEVLLDKVWQGQEGKRALARHVARVAVAAHWAWGDGPGATDAGLSALHEQHGVDPGQPRRRARAAVQPVRLAPRIPADQAWHVRGIHVTHWGPVNPESYVLMHSHYGRRLRCGLIINANWVPGYGGPACNHCVRGFE